MSNNLKYHKDTRTTNKYHKDIKAAWKDEDKVLKDIKKVLKGTEYKIKYNGSDKDRKIKSCASKVSSCPDILITNGEKDILVEFKSSNTDINFLSPKESECIQKCMKENALILYKRKVQQDYVLIDPTDPTHLVDTEVKENFLMGRKQCRYFEKDKLDKLKFDTLKEVVDNILIRR